MTSASPNQAVFKPDWPTRETTRASAGAGDTPPLVSITSPDDGSTFTSGAIITFTGTANDAEDGDISASIVWTSNLHPGVSATGASHSTNLLIDGTHTIAATVTDFLGNTTSRSITITVNPPP